MHVRIRGAIGIAAVAVALVAAGLVVGQRTAVSHAGHSYIYSAEQARAMVEQQAVPGSEFRVTCSSSHRGQDDPIVFQNRSGVSHMHEFFGNRTTNAFSTLTSLRAGSTNCNPVSDKSAYWVPTLYKNGQPVAPDSVTIYYQGIHDRTRAVAHPQGLRYVVGNAKAASPAENPAARWSCTTQSPSNRDFLNCPAGTKVETYLDFPTCWNGRDLDSANHRDHMAFAIGLVCPSSHPVVVPRLEFLITYPVNGTGLSLAGTLNGVNVTNAPGYTFHGDFMNAWEPTELERRVRNCINAGYICGTDGNP
ncbi:DUF1996 domain-containing protein [Lentzea sp. PSKA42]|uniref:DUF1996 domain-containing protein n=1 Tax=Lentzea indica TaxID=2604800 RepID=A0ABX1FCN6_9PSEU|nr:DUF1996 domain-containing protein [Lentzea indica]NKE56627.1 DUF1996 domain-containing protein [Lentzea indica]